jgi:hypothetical protein
MLFHDPCYWLDCNVFVQAKNGPYGFDIAPGFWRWLERQAKDGIVRSPINVYTELQVGSDPLSRWMRNVKKSTKLFVSPDRTVQTRFGEVAVFVQRTYNAAHAASFLAGADPWVIAHAMDDSGTVVTHETLGPAGCKQVKIPNVCDSLRVNCLGAYDAFRKLGLRL